MNAARHLSRPWRDRFFTGAAREWALVALIAFAFLLGGGSRADIASLQVLRPLAFLLLGYAFIAMTGDDVARWRGHWLMAAAMVAVSVVHLIPLPPALWTALPGRAVLAEVDRTAGLGPIWRSIAPIRSEAWNALFALGVPLAALGLLSVQRKGSFERVLQTLILIGAVSILLCLLQMLGPDQGPFYFFRITNAESPVGLFANRNHNAAFLAALLPVLAVWGVTGATPRRGQRDWRPFRQSLAFLGGTMALLFVLFSGSRGGLLLAVIASLAIPFVLGRRVTDIVRSGGGARPTGRWIDWLRNWRLLLAVLAIAAMLAMGVSGETLNRFADDSEGRPDMWRTTWRLALEHFPIGSGAGSFPDIYDIGEPVGSLGETYANHAHNDVLEVLMVYGLPGAVLLIVVLAVMGMSLPRLWSTRGDRSVPRIEGRLGFVVLSVLLLASLVDYPLRTPALGVMFVIASVWLLSGSRPVRTPLASASAGR